MKDMEGEEGVRDTKDPGDSPPQYSGGALSLLLNVGNGAAAKKKETGFEAGGSGEVGWDPVTVVLPA
jgi:hypothetical protein